jgi:beta-glucanase (GH16 family)
MKLKDHFTKLNRIIVFMLTLAISGCGMSTPSSSTATVIPPTADPTQLPIETKPPEPISTQTQTPITISDWQQVWSDEFNSGELDRSIWSFEFGPTNDCVHYFTDRPENAKVVDGKLHIIALEESYNGYNYTAAQLKTSHSINWRYGRIEARIKLPASNGFVPAFWMLPVDDLYGWWPVGGEIDIMEHPTNLVDMIYGTVHTGAYNLFTGSAPRGGTFQIPSAETEFHIYAIEWTEDKIDFYVDDQNYFTFQNEHTGFETWPFNQPFYLILRMGVGGGWVGNPDASSIFPAVMEVDYVRVFQDLHDISIYGPDFLASNSTAIPYSAPAIEGLIYKWRVPEGAQIISGQGTPEILVDWGTLGGNVELELLRSNGNINMDYPVEVSANLLMNGGFEKGAKYWHATVSNPAQADLGVTDDAVHSGTSAIHVNVKSPGINAWDVQLSQGNIFLETGNQYLVSLWAKADAPKSEISLAIINPNDFTLYGSQTVELSNQWAYYEMTFTVPINTPASFNIDMGESTGGFYFDDIAITIP